MEPLNHVSYVDDEPDMRMLVEATLQNIGNIKVTLCANGVDALKRAADENPQMIILDAMMHDMDGPAVLAALQNDKRLAHIPVIFLTAKTDPADLQSFMAQGRSASSTNRSTSPPCRSRFVPCGNNTGPGPPHDRNAEKPDHAGRAKAGQRYEPPLLRRRLQATP